MPLIGPKKPKNMKEKESVVSSVLDLIFGRGKATSPGAVDDDAVKRMKKRKKDLKNAGI